MFHRTNFFGEVCAPCFLYVCSDFSMNDLEGKSDYFIIS